MGVMVALRSISQLEASLERAMSEKGLRGTVVSVSRSEPA
jgi:hypothetical protein